MTVARKWGADPETVERWHPDTFAAVCDLLATEALEQRRANARARSRRR